MLCLSHTIIFVRTWKTKLFQNVNLSFFKEDQYVASLVDLDKELAVLRYNF